jgi:Domain of unknown function (DUF4382)
MMKTPRLPIASCLLVAALAGSSCGGGGADSGGGGSNVTAHTDILLRDAPADDLLSFTATITDLRLDDDVGGQTPNLLSGPVTQDLLGLRTNLAWLSTKTLPPGNYTALRMTVLAGSARRNDGVEVAVNAVSNLYVATFPSPLVVTSTSYGRVVADLDLASSLTGSITSPPLAFDPQGSAVHDDGGSEDAIDEVQGVVASVDAGSNSFVVDGFVDDEGTVPLGPVTVSISGSTILVRDDGGLFASQPLFFASIVPGATRVEVHGALANGAIQSTRVEVEDNASGGGNANLVKIRGRILDLGPGNTFEMSIAEVDDGATIVAAAFGGTIPGTLDVGWDAGTIFFLAEHAPTTSDALAIGSEIHVKFPVFANPPFVASRIEIESEGVEFEGHVTSTASLPASFVMHLNSDDPAILAGTVASSSTDVAVELAGSPVVLDVQGDPVLSAAAILAGQKIQPEGSIAGPPTAPTIAATKIKIFAGRLDDATVDEASRAGHTFHATSGQIDDPFGGGVVAGSLDVTIATGAVFDGDAFSESGFYDLFENLQGGQTLSVEIQGIGTGGATAIRAYEIRARVQG